MPTTPPPFIIPGGEILPPFEPGIITGLVAALLLVPAVSGDEGVPLSSFPMYATPRSAEVDFVVPVGLTEAGETVALSTRTIAGTSDPLIAESLMWREIRAGRAPQLCATIANRIDDMQVVDVEVRREAHQVTERALGRL